MLKIALDFDETLFPTMEKVLEIYNRRHNENITLSKITKYNLYESFSAEVADELLSLFVGSEGTTSSGGAT